MDEPLEVQVERIFDSYDEEVQKTVNDVIDSVSKEAVQKLKSTSPKRRRSGKYARSWTRKVETKLGIKSCTIYNARYAYLTHLLNNGHIIRNKSGTYGRKSGDNHIGNVEKWANQEVQSEIERRL